jgi:hypothetical protein
MSGVRTVIAREIVGWLTLKDGGPYFFGDIASHVTAGDCYRLAQAESPAAPSFFLPGHSQQFGYAGDELIELPGIQA